MVSDRTGAPWLPRKRLRSGIATAQSGPPAPCPSALVAFSPMGYGLLRTEGRLPGRLDCRADVAQLVEHHLAKVRVAGSNPVVRSEPRALVERLAPACGGVAERRGNGLQSRLHGFKSRLHLVSSAEHERGGGSGREAGTGDWRSGSALP